MNTLSKEHSDRVIRGLKRFMTLHGWRFNRNSHMALRKPWKAILVGGIYSDGSWDVSVQVFRRDREVGLFSLGTTVDIMEGETRMVRRELEMVLRALAHPEEMPLLVGLKGTERLVEEWGRS